MVDLPDARPFTPVLIGGWWAARPTGPEQAVTFWREHMETKQQEAQRLDALISWLRQHNSGNTFEDMLVRLRLGRNHLIDVAERCDAKSKANQTVADALNGLRDRLSSIAKSGNDEIDKILKQDGDMSTKIGDINRVIGAANSSSRDAATATINSIVQATQAMFSKTGSSADAREWLTHNGANLDVSQPGHDLTEEQIARTLRPDGGTSQYVPQSDTHPDPPDKNGYAGAGGLGNLPSVSGTGSSSSSGGSGTGIGSGGVGPGSVGSGSGTGTGTYGSGGRVSASGTSSGSGLASTGPRSGDADIANNGGATVDSGSKAVGRGDTAGGIGASPVRISSDGINSGGSAGLGNASGTSAGKVVAAAGEGTGNAPDPGNSGAHASNGGVGAHDNLDPTANHRLGDFSGTFLGSPDSGRGGVNADNAAGVGDSSAIPERDVAPPPYETAPPTGASAVPPSAPMSPGFGGSGAGGVAGISPTSSMPGLSSGSALGGPPPGLSGAGGGVNQALGAGLPAVPQGLGGLGNQPLLGGQGGGESAGFGPSVAPSPSVTPMAGAALGNLSHLVSADAGADTAGASAAPVAAAVPPPMTSGPNAVASASMSPSPAGPSSALPGYGADLRPASSTPVTVAGPANPAGSAGPLPTGPSTTPSPGGASVASTAERGVPGKLLGNSAGQSAMSPVARMGAGGITGTVAGSTGKCLAQQQDLQRKVDAVARQAPHLAWAAGLRDDETTIVLATDLAGGWIPPIVRLPAGITLLGPAHRRRDTAVADLLGPVIAVATHQPNTYVTDAAPNDPLPGNGERARYGHHIEELRPALLHAAGAATRLPRIVQTMALAVTRRTGFTDNEFEGFHLVLSDIQTHVMTAYPHHILLDAVDWMLLSAIDALVEDKAELACYHLAWHQETGIVHRQGVSPR